MATAIGTRTKGQVAQDAARMAGVLRGYGFASANSSTTQLEDTQNVRTAVADGDTIIGSYLLIIDGANAGAYREIETYATVGKMAWNTAMAAATATTSEYIRTSIRPSEILDAMDRVTRRASYNQAREEEVTSLATGNLLGHFGDFENFSSGNATVPDGWTATNCSVARIDVTSAVTPRHGDYAVQATDDGSGGGYIEHVVDPNMYKNLADATLRMRGSLQAASGDSGTIQIRATDEAGTVTTATWTRENAGQWEELEDISEQSFTLPSTLAHLVLRVTATGAGDIMYADDLQLYGPDWREHLLPQNIIGIDMQSVKAESSYRSAIYSRPIPPTHYDVFRRDVSANGVLRLKTALPPLLHLFLRGFRSPSVQGSITQNVDVNPEWLSLATALEVVNGLGLSDDGVRTRRNAIIEDLARLEAQPGVNPSRDANIRWFERP